MHTCWEGFTSLDAIKNFHDTREEVKISVLIRIWRKWIPALVDDFEEFKTLLGEVTADLVDIARELELQPEDGTESLSPDGKTSADELLLTAEQREWLLVMESTRGEDSLKVVDILLANESSGAV